MVAGVAIAMEVTMGIARKYHPIASQHNTRVAIGPSAKWRFAGGSIVVRIYMLSWSSPVHLPLNACSAETNPSFASSYMYGYISST